MLFLEEYLKGRHISSCIKLCLTGLKTVTDAAWIRSALNLLQKGILESSEGIT